MGASCGRWAAQRKWTRAIAALLVAGALAASVWIAGANRRAAAWFDRDRATWTALADGVAAQVLARGGDSGVDTGSDRFNGEWDFGTCQMAVVGLAQVSLAFPDTEPTYRAARERCLDWLVSPEARAFAEHSWGQDALAQLQVEPSHAYMGYANLALSLDRLVRPESAPSPHEAVNDALSEAFARWLRSPVHALRTYPGESYPPDISTAAASVAIRARALGQPSPEVLGDWVVRFRRAAVDPTTGWVYQSLSPADGAPVYGVRGSGTAFTASWLLWVDPSLAAELQGAHRTHGARSFLGFGGMREYGPGQSGWGDIDSGPVLLGVGVSATGFALSSARSHGDRSTHRRLYRTAHLFGLPIRGGRRFATGGGIGNAIMLAMLTAPTAQEISGGG